MKNSFRFLLALPLCLGLLSFTWRTDFEGAKADAKAQHKLILLKFSGSDWCIPCIRMEKEVFRNETFDQFADSALVMVNADFPRQKKNQPSKAVAVQNDALAARYNKDGHFPLTLLLAADGTVLKRWDGYSGTTPAAFIQEVQAARR